MDFDKLLLDLKTHLEAVQGKYVDAHIKSHLATPSEYDLDVKSFCILCHAAFEGFAEDLANSVLNTTIDDYTLKNKISIALVCLMHFKVGHKGYLEEEPKIIADIESSFEYIRPRLNEVKSTFANEIKNNHGFALKYLRRMLMPIGVDIPKNPIWYNSLNQLSQARGSYAHKHLEYGKVTKSISPEGAKDIVWDCYQLCEELKNRSKAVIA